MPYALGIDVGTTFTSAAIWADGRVEVISLESHRVSVPSVVFATGDELMFGSAAVARGATDPVGAAREFKRRLGDSVPLVLSGAPYSADRLVARCADWVVKTVTDQRGEAPQRVVITHPANWTEFQTHLLKNALDQVGLGEAGFLTEPQAAAIDFGGAAHLEPGELIVVYDLGGGTFDVAMLRRARVGFEHVGEPAGVERLGGIDFDEAIFQRVAASLPDEVFAEARTDQAGRMALLQLRRNCVEAKERLSEDVVADIPVLMPGAASTFRVTRSEFEEMIRPMLHQTIEAVRHVLDTSSVNPADLSAVLLVGGSSRIPAVSELVRDELGVPVRIDAHPKLVVARGAARWAGTGPVSSSTAATPRQRPRRAVVLAVIGAVVAVVAGAIALFAATRDSDAESTAETQPSAVTTAAPNTPARTSPSTTESANSTTTEATTTTIPEPPAIVGIGRSAEFATGPSSWTPLYEEGLVWAPHQGGVTVFDPRTDSVVTRIEVPGSPETPLGFDGRVWVPNIREPILTVLDAEDAGTVITTVEVGARGITPVESVGFVWVPNRGDGTVSRVHATTYEVETFAVAESVGDLTGTETGVAAVVGEQRFEIDRDGNVTPTEREPAEPTPRATANWSWSIDQDTITRLDPDTGAENGSVVVPHSALTESEQGLWLTRRGDDPAVFFIDEATLDVFTDSVTSDPDTALVVDGRAFISLIRDGIVSAYEPLTE